MVSRAQPSTGTVSASQSAGAMARAYSVSIASQRLRSSSCVRAAPAFRHARGPLVGRGAFLVPQPVEIGRQQARGAALRGRFAPHEHIQIIVVGGVLLRGEELVGDVAPAQHEGLSVRDDVLFMEARAQAPGARRFTGL